MQRRWHILYLWRCWASHCILVCRKDAACCGDMVLQSTMSLLPHRHTEHKWHSAASGIWELLRKEVLGAYCECKLPDIKKMNTSVTEEQFNPSLSGPSATSPGQRHRSCSGSASDTGGWTKVKRKNDSNSKNPEEIHNSGLSATGDGFLSKTLPFLHKGNRHPSTS